MGLTHREKTPWAVRDHPWLLDAKKDKMKVVNTRLLFKAAFNANIRVRCKNILLS